MPSSRDSVGFLQKLMQSAESSRRILQDMPGQLLDQIQNLRADFQNLGSLEKQSEKKKLSAAEVESKLKQGMQEIAGNALVPGGGAVAGMFKGPMAQTFSTGAAVEAQRLKELFLDSMLRKGQQIKSIKGHPAVPINAMQEIEGRTKTFQWPWDPKTWWQYDPEMFGKFGLKSGPAFKLSDEASLYARNPETASLATYSESAAGDLFNAEALFKAYPKLERALVNLSVGKTGGRILAFPDASFSGGFRAAAETVPKIERVSSHEFGHLIQDLEKAIGRGTNTDYLPKGRVAVEVGKLGNLLPQDIIKTVKAAGSSTKAAELVDKAKFNVYSREGGEVNARLIELLREFADPKSGLKTSVRDIKDLDYTDFITLITAGIRDPVHLNQIWTK